MLNVRHELPTDFLTLHARDLHHHLSGPTLFHLAGKRERPIFVSILLHGNEDVGLKAVQRVLSELVNKPLPRAMLLFVGNPESAQAGLRKLPHQFDFNRVWPGTDLPTSQYTECMRSVVDYAQQTGVFVSLDLHNNTGANPYYGCINRVDARSLQLATLFSRTVVYFARPLGVQSAAMAQLCPSITCECGKVGDEGGVARAADLLSACLHMQELPNHPPAACDYHLLRTVATIKVNSSASFGFDPMDAACDWLLPFDIALLNFRPLPAGTVFGRRRIGRNTLLLKVTDEQDQDVTDDYFAMVNDELVLNQCAVPSMLTTDIRVIRDDCFGYFMEEFDLVTAEAHARIGQRATP